MERWMPCFVGAAGEQISLGHPLIDEYLELVRARARRNTLLATAYDLKVFFEHVEVDPLEVTVADLLGFVKAQRHGPSSTVVRMDGSAGLALSTIKRRLSTLSGWVLRVSRRHRPAGAVTGAGRAGDSGVDPSGQAWCAVGPGGPAVAANPRT